MTILRVMIFSLSVLLASSNAFAQRDTGEEFADTILLTADGTLPSFDPFDLSPPDPTKAGLREALGWGDRRIKRFGRKAEHFFKEKFGFDFTNIQEDHNGVKHLPGVGNLLFVRFAEEANYQAVYVNRNVKGVPIDAMGYIVMITEPNVKYRGSFGGEEGVIAIPGEIAAYGVYKIGDKPIRRGRVHGRKDVVFFQQATPGRFTPEGMVGIFCDVTSPVYGSGKGEGTVQLRPLESGGVHVAIRNLLVFPGRLN